MRARALAATTAATTVAALLVAGAAAPALAAATPAPAAGSAATTLSLVDVRVAGHDLTAGIVALSSDTTGPAPSSRVVVTPLRVDGTAYGEQSITPASGPVSVPGVDSATVAPAAVSALARVQGPAVSAAAATSPDATSRAGTTSLGSVSLLGIPLRLDGTASASSLVGTGNAVGTKTVTLRNLALPSVAQLLAALGLDLSKLPVDTLTTLLGQLHLTDPAVTAAQQALDQAKAALQAQITAAQSAVDGAQAQLDTATTTLADKTAALNAATANLAPALAAVKAATAASTQADAAVAAAQQQVNAAQAAISAVLPGLPVSSTLTQALSAAQAILASATAAATTAATNLSTAQSAAQALQAVVDTAQQAVDTAQAAVTTLTATLTGLLDTLHGLLGQLGPQTATLLAAVTAVLDKTPLVSIDSLTVTTKALVTSNVPGGQQAEVVGGQVQGLHVLGTDVLSNVLGKSSVDLLSLAGGTLGQVTGAIAGLTGTLSSVLSHVPALPTLSIPAPQVGLLTKTTATGIVNGFGTASTGVTALQVALPAITIPAAVALPSAPGLAAPASALSQPHAVGDLTSPAISLSFGSLTDSARFRPAASVTPATPATPGSPGTPATPTGAGAPPQQLAYTGLPAAVGLLALVLSGAALLARRRLARLLAE